MVKTNRKIFEGGNLRGCIWNIYLEELELPDKAIASLIDKPPHNFDHMNYLEMLLDGYKVIISSVCNRIQLVIQEHQ